MLEEHSTTQEQWAKIPGWPAYEASDQGQIRSFWKRQGTRENLVMVIGDKPRILKHGFEPKTGHRHVTLDDGTGKRQKTFKVAWLVLAAFVRLPEPGEQALHTVDPDPSNNKLANLRWGSVSDNHLDMVRHKGKHPNSKLNPEQVQQIRELLKTGVQGKELAKSFKVCERTISMIKLGQTHRRHDEIARTA